MLACGLPAGIVALAPEEGRARQSTATSPLTRATGPVLHALPHASVSRPSLA
jgi:hypothetical protein